MCKSSNSSKHYCTHNQKCLSTKETNSYLRFKKLKEEEFESQYMTITEFVLCMSFVNMKTIKYSSETLKCEHQDIVFNQNICFEKGTNTFCYSLNKYHKYMLLRSDYSTSF